MPQPTDVKIVLPCHLEGEWLRYTVDSILEHTTHPSFHILVLANGDGRTDFSFIGEPAYRDRVRLRAFREALGVGNCLNEAVWPGDADYYVFLHAHSLVVQKDWLQRAIDCLDSHRIASMVQPEVVQFSYDHEPEPGEDLNVNLVEESGCAYSVSWAWPYESLGQVATVLSQRQGASPWKAMSGAGMAIFARAETFHRLGKFDPEVSGHYPEVVDYCVHGWLLGHPMIVDPTVRVYHRVKKTRHPEAVGYDDFHVIHGVLRTAYKYLSPRRRDLAETLFCGHGRAGDVERCRSLINEGRWVEERARFLRERVDDDDWLFDKFCIHEERFGTSSTLGVSPGRK